MIIINNNKSMNLLKFLIFHINLEFLHKRKLTNKRLKFQRIKIFKILMCRIINTHKNYHIINNIITKIHL